MIVKTAYKTALPKLDENIKIVANRHFTLSSHNEPVDEVDLL